jgi:phage N-6-adenine-methyltransferase
MTDPVMFSSESCEWGTPRNLLAALDRLFGPFELDPCARLEAFAKAPRWYTPRQNGLVQPWDGNAFCNPPWSRADPVDPWVEKAAASQYPATLLVPARTDTRWFQTVVYRAAVIVLISGRLTYERLETPQEREARHVAWWAKHAEAEEADDEKALKKMGKGPPDSTTAPFPSCVAFFDPSHVGPQIVGLMTNAGRVLVWGDA